MKRAVPFVVTIVLAMGIVAFVLVWKKRTADDTYSSQVAASRDLRAPNVNASPPIGDAPLTRGIPRTVDTSPRPLIPEFPMPPPQPYKRYDVTQDIRDLFESRIPNRKHTLGHLNTALRRVLTDIGYDHDVKYYVPEARNGFVLVTRIERIDADGRPAEQHRWVDNYRPQRFKEFSLGNYLEALFDKPEGYFRLFVFLVTDDYVGSQGELTWGEAQDWQKEGADALPNEIALAALTNSCTVSALVYVFEVQGKSGTPKSITSEVTGKKHLTNTGFLDALGDLIKKDQS
jgi:hypothetical protein